ncbi:hypothetical protein [Cupriavidus sp. UME77]|uniref:hypothetical protein n=1 Tax=Cupriavidus sp. UME77 TaxID=1862321 RepID=UPI00160466F3|nr:hypothetical protein [Cupriavidus sp. UME77]
MLKAPFTELPYTPTVASILAGLDVEYKDEAFKTELIKLDPSKKEDRQKIINDYIIADQSYLPYRHRFVLIKTLEEALSDNNYDFDSLFEYDYDSNNPTSSPWETSKIKTPRSFFEDIFRTANEIWKDDLLKAASEDQSTW